jgi:hypothetical protein
MKKNKPLIIGLIVLVIIIITFVIVKANNKKKKKKKLVIDKKGNTVEVEVDESGKPSWCDPENEGKNFFGWESDACVNYYKDLYNCNPDKPGYDNEGLPSVNCGFFG